MIEEKRRPHLVFGTRELERGELPVILRALTQDDIEVYHPARGLVTNEADVQVLEAHVNDLFKTSVALKVLASGMLVRV